MSGFIPKRVRQGYLGTKKNQTGLKVIGNPFLIGQTNEIKRTIKTRVCFCGDIDCTGKKAGKDWIPNFMNSFDIDALISHVQSLKTGLIIEKIIKSLQDHKKYNIMTTITYINSSSDPDIFLYSPIKINWTSAKCATSYSVWIKYGEREGEGEGGDKNLKYLNDVNVPEYILTLYNDNKNTNEQQVYKYLKRSLDKTVKLDFYIIPNNSHGSYVTVENIIPCTVTINDRVFISNKKSSMPSSLTFDVYGHPRWAFQQNLSISDLVYNNQVNKQPMHSTLGYHNNKYNDNNIDKYWKTLRKEIPFSLFFYKGSNINPASASTDYTDYVITRLTENNKCVYKPNKPIITKLSSTCNSITVEWSRTNTFYIQETETEKYKLQYKCCNDKYLTIPLDIKNNSHTITGLIPDKSYDIRIHAYIHNSPDCSSNSDISNIKTKDQSDFPKLHEIGIIWGNKYFNSNDVSPPPPKQDVSCSDSLTFRYHPYHDDCSHNDVSFNFFIQNGIYSKQITEHFFNNKSGWLILDELDDVSFSTLFISDSSCNSDNSGTLIFRGGFSKKTNIYKEIKINWYKPSNIPPLPSPTIPMINISTNCDDNENKIILSLKWVDASNNKTPKFNVRKYTITIFKPLNTPQLQNTQTCTGINQDSSSVSWIGPGTFHTVDFDISKNQTYNIEFDVTDSSGTETKTTKKCKTLDPITCNSPINCNDDKEKVCGDIIQSTKNSNLLLWTFQSPSYKNYVNTYTIQLISGDEHIIANKDISAAVINRNIIIDCYKKADTKYIVLNPSGGILDAGSYQFVINAKLKTEIKAKCTDISRSFNIDLSGCNNSCDVINIGNLNYVNQVDGSNSQGANLKWCILSISNCISDYTLAVTGGSPPSVDSSLNLTSSELETILKKPSIRNSCLKIYLYNGPGEISSINTCDISMSCPNISAKEAFTFKITVSGEKISQKTIEASGNFGIKTTHPHPTPIPYTISGSPMTTITTYGIPSWNDSGISYVIGDSFFTTCCPINTKNKLNVKYNQVQSWRLVREWCNAFFGAYKDLILYQPQIQNAMILMGDWLSPFSAPGIPVIDSSNGAQVAGSDIIYKMKKAIYSYCTPNGPVDIGLPYDISASYTNASQNFNISYNDLPSHPYDVSWNDAIKDTSLVDVKIGCPIILDFLIPLVIGSSKNDKRFSESNIMQISVNGDVSKQGNDGAYYSYDAGNYSRQDERLTSVGTIKENKFILILDNQTLQNAFTYVEGAAATNTNNGKKYIFDASCYPVGGGQNVTIDCSGYKQFTGYNIVADPDCPSGCKRADTSEMSFVSVNVNKNCHQQTLCFNNKDFINNSCPCPQVGAIVIQTLSPKSQNNYGIVTDVSCTLSETKVYVHIVKNFTRNSNGCYEKKPIIPGFQYDFNLNTDTNKVIFIQPNKIIWKNFYPLNFTNKNNVYQPIAMSKPPSPYIGGFNLDNISIIQQSNKDGNFDDINNVNILSNDLSGGFIGYVPTNESSSINRSQGSNIVSFKLFNGVQPTVIEQLFISNRADITEDGYIKNTIKKNTKTNTKTKIRVFSLDGWINNYLPDNINKKYKTGWDPLHNTEEQIIKIIQDPSNSQNANNIKDSSSTVTIKIGCEFYDPSKIEIVSSIHNYTTLGLANNTYDDVSKNINKSTVKSKAFWDKKRKIYNGVNSFPNPEGNTKNQNEASGGWIPYDIWNKPFGKHTTHFPEYWNTSVDNLNFIPKRPITLKMNKMNKMNDVSSIEKEVFGQANDVVLAGGNTFIGNGTGNYTGRASYFDPSSVNTSNDFPEFITLTSDTSGNSTGEKGTFYAPVTDPSSGRIGFPLDNLHQLYILIYRINQKIMELNYYIKNQITSKSNILYGKKIPYLSNIHHDKESYHVNKEQMYPVCDSSGEISTAWLCSYEDTDKIKKMKPELYNVWKRSRPLTSVAYEKYLYNRYMPAEFLPDWRVKTKYDLQENSGHVMEPNIGCFIPNTGDICSNYFEPSFTKIKYAKRINGEILWDSKYPWNKHQQRNFSKEPADGNKKNDGSKNGIGNASNDFNARIINSNYDGIQRYNMGWVNYKVASFAIAPPIGCYLDNNITHRCVTKATIHHPFSTNVAFNTQSWVKQEETGAIGKVIRINGKPKTFSSNKPLLYNDHSVVAISSTDTSMNIDIVVLQNNFASGIKTTFYEISGGEQDFTSENDISFSPINKYFTSQGKNEAYQELYNIGEVKPPNTVKLIYNNIGGKDINSGNIIPKSPSITISSFINKNNRDAYKKARITDICTNVIASIDHVDDDGITLILAKQTLTDPTNYISSTNIFNVNNVITIKKVNDPSENSIIKDIYFPTKNAPFPKEFIECSGLECSDYGTGEYKLPELNSGTMIPDKLGSACIPGGSLPVCATAELALSKSVFCPDLSDVNNCYSKQTPSIKNQVLGVGPYYKLNTVTNTLISRIYNKYTYIPNDNPNKDNPTYNFIGTNAIADLSLNTSPALLDLWLRPVATGTKGSDVYPLDGRGIDASGKSMSKTAGKNCTDAMYAPIQQPFVDISKAVIGNLGPSGDDEGILYDSSSINNKKIINYDNPADFSNPYVIGPQEAIALFSNEYIGGALTDDPGFSYNNWSTQKNESGCVIDKRYLPNPVPSFTLDNGRAMEVKVYSDMTSNKINNGYLNEDASRSPIFSKINWKNIIYGGIYNDPISGLPQNSISGEAIFKNIGWSYAATKWGGEYNGLSALQDGGIERSSSTYGNYEPIGSFLKDAASLMVGKNNVQNAKVGLYTIGFMPEWWLQKPQNF